MHWLRLPSFMFEEVSNIKKRQKSIIVMLFLLVWKINRLLLVMPVSSFKIYILKKLLSFSIVFKNKDIRYAKLTYFFLYLQILKKITICLGGSKLLLFWIIWDLNSQFTKEVNLKVKCQVQINKKNDLHHQKTVHAKKVILLLKKFHKWME